MSCILFTLAQVIMNLGDLADSSPHNLWIMVSFYRMIVHIFFSHYAFAWWPAIKVSIRCWILNWTLVNFERSLSTFKYPFAIRSFSTFTQVFIWVILDILKVESPTISILSVIWYPIEPVKKIISVLNILFEFWL